MASEGIGRGAEYSEQTRTSSSSSSSSSYYSPPREFSFDDGDAANGSSLLLSAKAVEMTPADEIFFGGHLLPLHLLSHFRRLPSPRLSSDDSDTFTLPIEDFPPYRDRSTGSNDGGTDSSSKGNFKGKCGNRIHSETTPHVSPSDGRGRGNKAIPLSLFGLSRWRKAREVRGGEGNQDKERTKSPFELKKTVKRYVRMASPLLSFRGRRTEIPAKTLGSGGLRGPKMPLSAPASITTSPRNSGLFVRKVELSGTVKDSRVDELQAAIQAAIAYCKKSIAAEEEEGKLQT